VDLVRLAGCRPIAVICEIMKRGRLDGAASRTAEVRKKSAASKLAPSPTLSISGARGKKLVEHIESVKMPTDYGNFDCTCIVRSWMGSITLRSFTESERPAQRARSGS